MHFRHHGFAVLSVVALILVNCVPSRAFAQCTFPASTSGRVITYTFDPTVTATATVLHVTVSFTGTENGQEEIQVPTHWAGEQLRAVTNLRALSADVTIADSAESDAKTIRYPPNQPVRLGYDLVKDWTGPFVHPLQFHPVLTPDYVEINGDNGLVFPKFGRQSASTVRFDWQKLPAAWALATSFATSAGPTDRCQSFSGPFESVLEALFTAGDFRIYHFQIGKRPAVLAIRGQWTFTDEQAVSDIQRAVGVVRDFWKDDDFPYFLVTVKAYDQDHGNSDGSAFTNAFWMYISRLDTLSTQLNTLAHETFHAWDPRKMGSLSGEDDVPTQWFKEGFTRYYADVLTYRAGLLPLSSYVDNLNLDLRKFPASTDVYVRGRIIALWLDAEIRAESHGAKALDDVMFDMVRGADQPITLARILATAGAYVTPEARGLLARAASEQGNLPPPQQIPVVGTCAHLAMDELPTFDVGFDLAASRAGKKISGVKPDGPAFAAGLRDGQPLVGVSFYNDRPDMMAKFTIHTDTGDQPISYDPRGKTITVPQYHAEASATCKIGGAT